MCESGTGRPSYRLQRGNKRSSDEYGGGGRGQIHDGTFTAFLRRTQTSHGSGRRRKILTKTKNEEIPLESRTNDFQKKNVRLDRRPSTRLGSRTAQLLNFKKKFLHRTWPAATSQRPCRVVFARWTRTKYAYCRRLNAFSPKRHWGVRLFGRSREGRPFSHLPRSYRINHNVFWPV